MVNKSEDYRFGLDGANPKYETGPTLGSYRTSETPFKNPEGIHVFEGFGANAEDLERGWCKFTVDEKPVYDLDNYKERWSEPAYSDLVEGGPGLARDFAFRDNDRYSKGFLTRPRIPRER